MRQASDNPLKRSSWVMGILNGVKGESYFKIPPYPLKRMSLK
ncbi:hypothetical protein HMPREF1427_00542 [Helicobacter pylori GAM83Bi]|nr:hypothetical protein HMPREF1428_01216 [Helicobacter pylori GAM83T]EMH38451.1 hypothetical protein HMPREF1427_00542 [Helicobacter pylori GAM83Bi]